MRHRHQDPYHSKANPRPRAETTQLDMQADLTHRIEHVEGHAVRQPICNATGRIVAAPFTIAPTCPECREVEARRRGEFERDKRAVTGALQAATECTPERMRCGCCGRIFASSDAFREHNCFRGWRRLGRELWLLAHVVTVHLVTRRAIIAGKSDVVVPEFIPE